MDSDSPEVQGLLGQIRALVEERRESAFEAVTREQLSDLKADVERLQQDMSSLQRDMPALANLQGEVREVKRLVLGLLSAVALAVLVEVAKLAVGLR